MNGYHSGRSVGAPITDLALNMLKRISDQGLSVTESYTSYNTVNQAGEHLKSSTIPLIGENGRVIGLLCINFYIDSPLSEVLQSLMGSKSEQPEQEYFANSVSDTMAEAVNNARSQVMLNSNIPAVNKNKEIIRILDGKGVFRIKDSVSRVADSLGVSKNTVYLHLRSISEGKG
jgi:predicted transcriptional regulator YheO